MISPTPLLDELLSGYQASLGGDFQPYRNHCQRVYALTCALAEREDSLSDSQREALQIALAFHDIGIWASNTFDYLEPSAELARVWLDSTQSNEDIGLINAMIVDHHKIRPALAVDGCRLPEYVRRADLIDVSLGTIRFGLPRAMYRELKRSFPIAGFHRRLVGLALHWWLRHPLRPMPMLRW